MCYIFQVISVRRLSNHKSDLPGQSVLLVLVPFNRPHDFLLVIQCNHVSILYHFPQIIGYLPKFK